MGLADKAKNTAEDLKGKAKEALGDAKNDDQLKAEGKPYEIGLTASQYEGYVVNVNNFFNAYGATFVNEDSTQATVNDKAVQALTLLKKLATSGVTSPSLSNAQEPEVFADLEAGRSAFSVNWPYVLSAMRSAAETNPRAQQIGRPGVHDVPGRQPG